MFTQLTVYRLLLTAHLNSALRQLISDLCLSRPPLIAYHGAMKNILQVDLLFAI